MKNGCDFTTRGNIRRRCSGTANGFYYAVRGGGAGRYEKRGRQC